VFSLPYVANVRGLDKERSVARQGGRSAPFERVRLRVERAFAELSDVIQSTSLGCLRVSCKPG
jgi:hypothetical protein